MLRTASLVAASLALAPCLRAQSAMGALPTGSMPTRMSWELATPPAAVDVRAADLPAHERVVPTSQISSDSVAFAEPDADGVRAELGLHARFNASTDFGSDPGSVTTARGGWDGRIAWSRGASSSFTLGLHTEASFYDFSGASGLVPGSGNGEPVNDVLLSRFAATWCSALGERTSWFASGILTIAAEDSVSFGDSATAGLVTGLRHRPDEALELEYGLAALTLLEDSTWVFPYFGFDWRVSDRVRLSSQGAKVELAADVADAWTLFGSALYDLREYRLAEDNPLPEGVLRDHEIDLALGIRWRPSAHVRVDLGAGLAAWREIEFQSSGGSTVSETETDPGLLGQFAVRVEL